MRCLDSKKHPININSHFFLALRRTAAVLQFLPPCPCFSRCKKAVWHRSVRINLFKSQLQESSSLSVCLSGSLTSWKVTVTTVFRKLTHGGFHRQPFPRVTSPTYCERREEGGVRSSCVKPMFFAVGWQARVEPTGFLFPLLLGSN